MRDVAEDLDEGIDREHTDEDYEHAKRVEMPVMITKVDCELHKELCQQQGIMAYPTLRLFVDGERWKGGDYRNDRTLVAMTDYLQQIEVTHKTDLGVEKEKNVQLAHKGKARASTHAEC